MPTLPWGVSPLRYATPSEISDASRRRRHCASVSILARRLRVAATRSEAASNSPSSMISLRDKMAKLIKSSDENVAKVVCRIEELGKLVGKEVAVTDWFTVSQERIDGFARATEDHQWIHVDRERAARESPYGTTIAHGFLTLSLVSFFVREAIQIRGGVRIAVNYGLNRVRFPSAVPSDSKIRARIALLTLKELRDAAEVIFGVTIEHEKSAKPCCVAEW